MSKVIGRSGRELRGVRFSECCGHVCDERCREAQVRDQQFGRRVSAVGGFRVS